jgi:hypothetical protein
MLLHRLTDVTIGVPNIADVLWSLPLPEPLIRPGDLAEPVAGPH